MQMSFMRVLEHDTCDQIRIGASFPVIREQVAKVAETIIHGYDKQLEWRGGWNEENAREFYKRIALVDADSLQVLHEVWSSEGTKKRGIVP